jgi:hypothetical protein
MNRGLRGKGSVGMGLWPGELHCMTNAERNLNWNPNAFIEHCSFRFLSDFVISHSDFANSLVLA